MPKYRDGNEQEEINIRFVDVRVKGGSATLQTAIRAITDAVGNRPAITRVAPIAQLQDTSSKEKEDVKEQPELNFDDVQEGDFEDAKPTETKPKRVIAPHYPKPLNLDLSSGSMPFEKFCHLKSPSTDNAKYLVVASWLKDHRSTEMIKVNHVLSCFLHMKWDVPKDLRTCFRQLTSKGQMEAHKGGFWGITYNGTSDVNKMGG